ncbi:hypothetical protein D3C72_804270 [compost metagenome]
MPLNPKRKFDTVLEGPLRLNEDGMWALYEDDEEISYWDEGQEIEVQRDGAWVKGPVVWTGDGYGLGLDGETVALSEGTIARRRVGGSI